MPQVISKVPRVGPLKDGHDIGRELRRVYRQFRYKEILEDEAKTATHILKTLSSVYRDNTVEELIPRIELLEQRKK
jgi:hypothetical protein